MKQVILPARGDLQEPSDIVFTLGSCRSPNASTIQTGLSANNGCTDIQAKAPPLSDAPFADLIYYLFGAIMPHKVVTRLARRAKVGHCGAQDGERE